MFLLRLLPIIALTFLTSLNPALSQDLPPQSTYQAMLDYGKKSGWIAFRNFNGKQLVYFTHLQTMHCRLKEIRYSINSSALDQRFKLVKCHPQLPFSLPSDAGVKEIAISLPLGTAKSVTVQVQWGDGRESEIVVYEPCKDVGERTCTSLVK